MKFNVFTFMVEKHYPLPHRLFEATTALIDSEGLKTQKLTDVAEGWTTIKWEHIKRIIIEPDHE